MKCEVDVDCACRERAIELCEHAHEIGRYIARETLEITFDSAANQLALAACDAINVLTDWRGGFPVHLEAAALLREGWNPGDPIHKRCLCP